MNNVLGNDTYPAAFQRNDARPGYAAGMATRHGGPLHSPGPIRQWSAPESRHRIPASMGRP